MRDGRVLELRPCRNFLAARLVTPLDTTPWKPFSKVYADGLKSVDQIVYCFGRGTE